MLSNLNVLAMVVGVLVLLLMTTLGNARVQSTRAWVCAVTGALAGFYIVWRLRGALLFGEAADGLGWLWVSAIVDVISLLDFLLFLLLVSRFTDRRAAASRKVADMQARDPATLPSVDVWIASYNEEWNILEKTLIGALALDWPPDKLRIHMLDDGRRAWLAENCAELGISYISRPDNRGRKAGNHNNALAATSAPYILSLDADFVPFPNAIWRLLGCMESEAAGDVAIVQSPQVFYNYEPFRNNMLLHDVVPDDLELFYKVMQPARDAWNASFYCGTSALLRRAALEQVGGFAEDSDIEDQITSLRLWQSGWRTIYLDEQLSHGLAPESVATLHDQRNRWCRGSLQILFTRHGLFARGFTFMQRLLFTQSYWLLGAFIPVFYALLPSAIWLFDAKLFPRVDPAEIIFMPLLLLVGIWIGFCWIAQRSWLPVLSQAFQLFLAIEMLPTAIATLVKPFGKPLIRILPVTTKGSASTRAPVDLLTFHVLLSIIALTIGALVVAALVGVETRGPAEILVALIWTMLDLVTCTIALMGCLELPYHRTEERRRSNDAIQVQFGDQISAARLLDISLGGARLSHVAAAVGSTILLLHPLLGTHAAIVVRHNPDGSSGVRFATLDDGIRPALIQLIYLSPMPHDIERLGRLLPILQGLSRRFLRRDY
jgi:cellulose synthase (UDP-forming)